VSIDTDSYGRKPTSGDTWLPSDPDTQPIEVRCLRSTRSCRALRRSMSADELDTAYRIERDGRCRQSVLLLLVLQRCRLERAASLKRIARVKPKPRRVARRKGDYRLRPSNLVPPGDGNYEHTS
jgi:hypothetical protein